MDNFKDRLSQHAHDTGRPALAHQCRGRDLSPVEQALADQLMDIYGVIGHDFSAVITELTIRKVVAPKSGRIVWDAALFEEELACINRDLDRHYESAGYGA